MKSFIEFILKRRKAFTLMLIGIGLVGIFIPSYFFIRSNKEIQNSIETVYYLSQIIASIFVITGVVIAGWQYYLTSRAELSKLQLEKVQKSIELASFYKDNVLNKYRAIKYVYNETGIMDILHKIKRDEMKKFDIFEMERLLSESDIKKLKEIEESDEFIKSILEANMMFNLHLRIVKKAEFSDEDGKGYVIDRRPILIGFFSDLLSDLMNNMELFAMYYTHKAADDSVVFQSLHQTYLEIVQALYYQISKMNDAKKGEYYTNITELYHDWYKECMDLSDKKVKSTKKGTTVADFDVDK